MLEFKKKRKMASRKVLNFSEKINNYGTLRHVTEVSKHQILK